jgi:hypothetical protein
MIIFVRTGKEIQDRHICGVKTRHIGRQIRAILKREVESGSDVSLLDQPPPRMRRANPLQRELVVPHAADHVGIYISNNFVERHGRMLAKRGRADQPNFFA